MRGHVRQRSPGSWSVVVDLGRDPKTGKRQQQWHTVHGTKREAERFLAQLLVDIDRGSYVAPTKVTVAEYLSEWIKSAAANLAPNSLSGYTVNIEKHILPTLGHLPLKRLTPMAIQGLYSDLLASGLSNRTVHYVHATLRVALAHAVRMGLIHTNPASVVSAPKVTRPEISVLSPESVAPLLDALRGERLYMPVLLALATGMRRGEILGLTWQQVDFAAGMLHVTQALQDVREGTPTFSSTKTTKSRRAVALPASVLAELQTHRQEQLVRKSVLGEGYRDFGLVVCIEDGRPWRQDQLSTVFRQRMDKLGFTQIRFHDLRHTHATLLLWKGVHPKVVSERLGHSAIGITMDTYSHVMPVLQREAADVLDSTFVGRPPLAG